MARFKVEHRGVDVPVRHAASVGGVGRRRGANLPRGGTVRAARPTVVRLRRSHVRQKRVRFENRPRRVCKKERFALALVDLEVGVEKPSHVQVGRELPFPGTNHEQMPARRDHGSRWDLKLFGVVGVVAQKVPSKIHRSGTRVVKLHEVFVVAPHVQRVVAARKLVDDDLRLPSPGHEHPHPNQSMFRRSMHGVVPLS